MGGIEHSRRPCAHPTLQKQLQHLRSPLQLLLERQHFKRTRELAYWRCCCRSVTTGAAPVVEAAAVAVARVSEAHEATAAQEAAEEL